MTSLDLAGRGVGPNRKPDTMKVATSANPITTWKACAATPSPDAQGEAGQRPEQAERDRGDGKPSPHPRARQHEGGRGHDREVDVERPEVRLVAVETISGVT